MSLRDTGTGDTGATTQPNSTAMPHTNPATSWNPLTRSAPGGLSKQPTGEVLAKATEVVTKAIKAMPIDAKDFEVNVIPVSNSLVSNLSLSSIVVTVSKAGSTNRCWTVALLEGSAEPFAPKPETINGVQVQIDKPASVAYDQFYQQTIQGILTQSFPNNKLTSCSAQVVPREFNFDDIPAVKEFVINMLMPLFTIVNENNPNLPDINLAALDPDIGFGVTLNFNRDALLADSVGLPVRNDLSINLSASSKKNTSSPNSLNNNNRSNLWSRANGFIDLVWVGGAEKYNPYTNQAVKEPKFSARLVLTRLESGTITSLSAQLLALLSAFSLAEGTTWFPAFTPKQLGVKGGKALDLGDIGAINYEANVLNQKDNKGQDKGQIIDTKTATFDSIALGKLITEAIRPGLIISMDISDCGADTAPNEAFLAAGNGSSGAQQAIIDAANGLTGGEFSRHYTQTSDQPVLLSNEVIQLGSYTDSEGTLRDLRTIDYLAMANILGGKDMNALYDWTQTFTNLEYPIEQRLDARRKMMQHVVSDMKITGFGKRITFSSYFISSLFKACAAIGMNIRLENTGMNQNFVTQRATFEYANQTNMFGAGNGLFGRGVSNFSNRNFQSQPINFRF